MLTEERLKLRKSGIGGSDVSAILGLNPFQSAVDVYLAKTTDILPQVENFPMAIGNAMEGVVAKGYEKKISNKQASFITLEEANTLFHETENWALANIDRWVAPINPSFMEFHFDWDARHILECKTAGWRQAEKWGEPGSDVIPDEYLAQVAWYAFVADVQRVDIAVLIDARDFRIYTYNRNKALEDRIVNSCSEFWRNNVLKRIAPEPRTYEDAKSLFPSAKQDVQILAPDYIANDDIPKLKRIKSQIKELQEDVDKIQADICAKIGDGDTLVDAYGNVLATWKNQIRKPYEVKESIFRQLRVK